MEQRSGGPITALPSGYSLCHFLEEAGRGDDLSPHAGQRLRKERCNLWTRQNAGDTAAEAPSGTRSTSCWCRLSAGSGRTERQCGCVAVSGSRPHLACDWVCFWSANQLFPCGILQTPCTQHVLGFSPTGLFLSCPSLGTPFTPTGRNRAPTREPASSFIHQSARPLPLQRLCAPASPPPGHTCLPARLSPSA